MDLGRIEITHTLIARGEIEVQRRQEGAEGDVGDPVVEGYGVAHEGGAQGSLIPAEFVVRLKLNVREVVRDDAAMEAVVLRQRVPEAFQLNTRSLMVSGQDELHSLEHGGIDEYRGFHERIQPRTVSPQTPAFRKDALRRFHLPVRGQPEA